MNYLFEDVEIDGIVALRKELESMLSTSNEFEDNIRLYIRDALEEARSELQERALSVIKSDPHKAAKAIKVSIYKRILGGSVSILNSRRSGSMNLIEPKRTLRPGQRGGNRIPRSQRTEDLLSYTGKDRAFILRFVEFGTKDRESRFGFRGSISGCSLMSSTVMERAADYVAGIIEREYFR